MRYYCVLKSFLDLPILSSESQGSLYFLHCLIFKMLLLIFGDELFYYTTFKFICQPLFRSFSNFLFCGAPSCETALILYHIQSSLSSTFSSFFKKLFCDRCSVSRPAFLLYHIQTHLSTPFQKFFQICFSVIPQLSLRQLFYYITFSSACQVLFI